MDKSTKIAKESTISFFGMGFGQLLRYLFTTVLARLAGADMLGIYSIANAITRIFEVIGKLGLDQGIIRYVSQIPNNEGKRQKILSALKMGIISSLFFMLIQILLAKWLATNIFNDFTILNKVIIIHAISLPFCIIIHIAANATQAYKILKYKMLVTEIQNPIILLITMIIVYLLFTVEYMIMIPVIISSVLGSFTINIFIRRISKISILSSLSNSFDKNLLNYSLPIMFMAVLGTVLHWTDVLMLGYYTDSTTVGLYHPAARTAGIIRIVLASFAGIYGPFMAEMYSNKMTLEMNKIFKLVTRWIITFASPFAILILLFPKNIMLIFGNEFVNGYNILIILTIAALIQAVFGLSGTTLNMTGFPKINLINTFIACGLNIILNFILIPKIGAEGAAISTLVTLIFIALIRGLQNWILIKLIPFSLDLTKPFFSAIVTTICMLFIRTYILSFNNIVILFSSFIIIFALFFIILWLCGLDDDDLGLVKGIKVILNLNTIKN